MPVGGTIADGTYFFAGGTFYSSGTVTAPQGTFSAVFEIAGNTMQQVGSVNGSERRYTSTFTTSGTTISTIDSCPAADSAMHQFTATADAFDIYDSSTQGTLEQKYTRR